MVVMLNLFCRNAAFRVHCFVRTMSTTTQGEIKKISLKDYGGGRERVGPFGWFLLIVPVASFGLGTWQVQRKMWKERLIRELYERSNAKPVPLPENVDQLAELEYCPIHVRGQFLHNKEICIGPRSLLKGGDASTQSSLISKEQSKSQGFWIITPFKLNDRDQTILVNRGWVPKDKRDPRTRREGQIEGTTDVIGLVRLHENRPSFVPPNKPESNSWFYRDLNQMSAITGADPIYLDATDDFPVDKGPIGGQTRITLRNEHLSYIFTWYSLSLLSSILWYKQIYKGR